MADAVKGRMVIVEGDITRLKMDAIVNAAKRALLGGGVKPAERSSACGSYAGRRAPGKEGTPLAATVTVVLGADPGKGNDGRRG